MASITRAFSDGISHTWTRFGSFALAGVLLFIAEFVYLFNDRFYLRLIEAGGDPFGFTALSYATDLVFVLVLTSLGVWVYTMVFRSLRSSDEPVFTGGRVGWTLLYNLILAVFVFVFVFAAMLIVGAGSAVTFILLSSGSLIAAGFIGILSAILLIGGAIMTTYFFIRLFTFPVITIADRSCDPFVALATSWRMTHGRVLQIIGLSFMLGLFNLAGLLALVVGLVFTIPASLVIMSHFYEQIRTEAPTV